MLNVVEDVNVVATKIKVVKVKNNFFLSESRCSERSSNSSEIKICYFSRSWRSKRSGEINFIINKKNKVFCPIFIKVYGVVSVVEN